MEFVECAKVEILAPPQGPPSVRAPDWWVKKRAVKPRLGVAVEKLYTYHKMKSTSPMHQQPLETETNDCDMKQTKAFHFAWWYPIFALFCIGLGVGMCVDRIEFSRKPKYASNVTSAEIT